MKILLINHYAGSPELGMEFRPFYMAKEWGKLGHDTLIVGGSFSHLRRIQPTSKNKIIDGVHYSWVGVNKYEGNGVGRILSMFLFIFKLFFRFKRYLGDFRPDVVIASSTYPMDIYPARKIAKYYGAKLIYEVHDLWPLSPIELGGYSKNHPFIRIVQAAENYCYRHVDAVVSMLPAAENHMLEHGLVKDKFYYVPNGIVVEAWDNFEEIPDEHKKLLARLHNSGTFVVGFAGAHGIANSLYAIIDAVANLNHDNVALVLVGGGQEKNNLMRYVVERNISNVYFLPPINKKEIPSLLKEMDALYIGLQKQSLFRFGISPNKLFDYMMAGKPVIQAIDAGNNIVREANCGVDVEPDNVESIRSAVLYIKNMPELKRQKLGENGHKFVLENHTYHILAKRFADIMTNLITNENNNSNRSTSSIH